MITLKHKPVKPARMKVKEMRAVYNGALLKDVLEMVPEGVEARFDVDEGYDGAEVYLVWEADEHEQAFQGRMATYEKDLARYNKWYEKNKAAVDREIERRAEEKVRLRQRDLEKQRKYLLREEENIRKQLESIEKDIVS